MLNQYLSDNEKIDNSQIHNEGFIKNAAVDQEEDFGNFALVTPENASEGATENEVQVGKSTKAKRYKNIHEQRKKKNEIYAKKSEQSNKNQK